MAPGTMDNTTQSARTSTNHRSDERREPEAPKRGNGAWEVRHHSCAGITPIRFDGRRQFLVTEVAALSARLPELPLRCYPVVQMSLRLGVRGVK